MGWSGTVCLIFAENLLPTQQNFYFVALFPFMCYNTNKGIFSRRPFPGCRSLPHFPGQARTILSLLDYTGGHLNGLQRLSADSTRISLVS